MIICAQRGPPGRERAPPSVLPHPRPFYLHPPGSASSVLPGMLGHQIPYRQVKPHPTRTHALAQHLCRPPAIGTLAHASHSYLSIALAQYREGVVTNRQAGQSLVTSFITVGIGLGGWHPSLSPQRERQAPWQPAPDPDRASCPAPRINVLSVGMALAEARSHALLIQLAQGP